MSFPIPRHQAGALCAAAAAVLALAAAGPAAAQAGTGLTGLWLLDQHTYDSQEDFRPPLTAEVVAKVEADRKAQRDGGKVLSDNGKMCLPIGMPGMVTNEFALKFLETPGEITVVSENSPLVRTLYLNEKAHPADYEPTWNGHSIARWDGKVLTVDTVGMNDRTGHVTGARGVRSLKTHIVERYHLEDGGKTLVNAITFDDPTILSRAWTVTYKYHRAEAGAELWEYVCEPNTEGWSERFAGDPEFKGPKTASAAPAP